MIRITDLGKTILFFAVTFLLIAVTAFCITQTVMSKSNFEENELEEFYREQEKEWLQQTREQLDSLGFRNSGVTLTRVVDVNGEREYTFTIHHEKMEKMSGEQRAELVKVLADNRENIAENNAVMENCIFYHEFLAYE